MLSIVLFLVLVVGAAAGFFGGVYVALIALGADPAEPLFNATIFTIAGMLFEHSPHYGNLVGDLVSSNFGFSLAQYYPQIPQKKMVLFGLGGASFTVISLAVLMVPSSKLKGEPDAGKADKSDESKESEVLKLGDRVIPYEYESEHMIAVGATGVGKSQALRAAVTLARRRKNPALVLDIGGELTSRLYRPGKDFIIAAHDAQSVDWSPLAEMHDHYDAERLAAAMIPLGKGGDSEEWARMARIYTEACLISVFDRHSDQKPATNSRLAAELSSADPDELLEVVGEDSPAAGLLRPGAERMLASVVGTASSKASALRALPPEGGINGWSIKDWVSRVCDHTKPYDERDSWLFVPIPHEYGDSGKPLASIIAGFVVQSVLAMPEADRRLWFFCDELGQYPAINAMSEALTLGRKYGLSCAHAVQTIDQLEKHYGRNGCVELLANYATKVMFRQGDDRSADWSSLQIGDSQIRRFVTSNSSSSQGMGKGSSNSESVQEQITIERSILPSEFMGLPKLRACIKTAANPGDVLFCALPYIDIGEQVTPPFVPRARKPRVIKKSKPVEKLDENKDQEVIRALPKTDTDTGEGSDVRTKKTNEDPAKILEFPPAEIGSEFDDEPSLEEKFYDVMGALAEEEEGARPAGVEKKSKTEGLGPTEKSAAFLKLIANDYSK